MPRVLLYINRLERGGGTETHLLSLAQQLKSLGYKIGVFTTGGPWVKYFSKHDIQVHVPNPRTNSRVFIQRMLKTVIETYHYDLLHVHDSEGITAAESLRQATIPIVVTIHGLYVAPERIIRSAQSAAAIIAVSPEVANYVCQYCGVPCEKVHLIWNGIPTDQFVSKPARNFFGPCEKSPDQCVIGYAGRFTLDKIAVSKQICTVLDDYADQIKSVCVLIAGRGSKRFANKYPHITTLGHVPNMEQFYNSCTAVIGTGRVALESLACETPTVAIGQSGYVGIVTTDNFQNALNTNFGDHVTVPVRWSPQMLIHDLNALRNNLATVQTRTTMVSKMIRSSFTAQHMAEEVIRVYRDLL